MSKKKRTIPECNKPHKDTIRKTNSEYRSPCELTAEEKAKVIQDLKKWY